jgi:hypothetical protein
MADQKDSVDTAAAAADESKKRSSAADWSPDERTLPKRFKSMEPDTVVVVGGVEFFHFKCFLCRCPYFDNMFASGMKESQENCIEFPDKDPDTWPKVYNVLDAPDHSKNVDQRIEELCSSPDPFVYLEWFDFLGCEELVRKLDESLAEVFRSNYGCRSLVNYSRHWIPTKNLPCPETREFLWEHVESYFELYLSVSDDSLPSIKSFLLDEQSGDELWELFTTRSVKFPARMMETMDKQSIVNAPTFKFLIAMGRRIKGCPMCGTYNL